MKKLLLLLSLCLFGGSFAHAQDYSGRAATSPVSVKIGLPGRCNQGQLSIDITATAGQNLYVCGLANDWYAVGSPANGVTTQTVATGTATLGTSAISSGACATVVTAVATGALTSDNLVYDFTTDQSGITGYGASASGSVRVEKFITSAQANFKICNSTSGSITPGAATLRWRVIR